jgi:hypothetical protein
MAMSPSTSSRTRPSSSAIPPRASRAFPSTAWSVVEKTTFGSACQMPANSRSVAPIDGSRSAVSQ